ncbi:hypothetical protein Gohar_026496, partial [Gossypium harknessii]|nr:hypothetical protein [Gossypium harknessii]
MRFTLANVWHPIGSVSILDLGVGFYLEVDVESIEQNGPWMLVHDIPHGFMSENVAKQLGNFIGAFLDYDTSFIQSGNMRVMRIRVKLDVRRSLQRRKSLLFPMIGAWEKFTLWKQNVVFHWDLSLRAPPRRAVVWKSKWLMERGTGGGKNLGIFLFNEVGIRLDSHKWYPINQEAMGGINSNLLKFRENKFRGYCTMDQSSGKVTGPNVNVQHVNFDEEMGFLKGEDVLVQLVEGFKRPRTKGGFGWAIGCGAVNVPLIQTHPKLSQFEGGTLDGTRELRDNVSSSFEGSPRIVHCLRNMLRDINLSVVFLIEKKLNVSRMAIVRRKCGFEKENRVGHFWICTGFYGALEERLREESWNLLCQLNDLPNVPWLIIGDFNKI